MQSPKKFLTLATILVGLCILLAPPAQAYKKVHLSYPSAPANSMEGVEQLAVLDLEASDSASNGLGRIFADRFIKSLMTNYGSNDLLPDFSGVYFKIIERSRLEAVLAEQAIGGSGMVDNTQAASIGEILGADAIISGEVSTNITSKRTREEREIWRNERWIPVIVNCDNKKVIVTTSVRVVSSTTGEILATGTHTATEEAKNCEGDESPMPSSDEMAQKATESCAYILANLITPTWGVHEVEFDKIKAKPVKDDAKKAAEAADKDGNWHKAYALYKKVYEQDPYNPKAIYNMGVVYEAGFDYAKAKELYEGAAFLKDDKKYKQGLERINHKMDSLAYFESRDDPIVPYDFEAATAGRDMAADKIEIDGKSQDRRPVHAAADESSKVIANIPGEIEVPVLGKEGDWYKIKLPVGPVKEGFIHKDNVKD